MKGIILSEFVEFLEEQLGFEIAQQIIDDSGVASKGAYSRVGQYDYQELIQLLTQTVKETSKSADELIQPFANHLFKVFRRDYSVFFDGVNSAAHMLTTIDDHIHVEVKKLYPDAELPKFNYEDTGDQLILNYQSPRPLADIAQAMVIGCLQFFDDKETLAEAILADDRCSARFVIHKQVQT